MNGGTHDGYYGNRTRRGSHPDGLYGIVTKSGDWDATGNTITRTWSDDSEMKITATPDGVTVTYARQ